MSDVREASLEPGVARLPGGWIAQIGPFALLAVVAGGARTGAVRNQFILRLPLRMSRSR